MNFSYLVTSPYGPFSSIVVYRLLTQVLCLFVIGLQPTWDGYHFPKKIVWLPLSLNQLRSGDSRTEAIAQLSSYASPASSASRLSSAVLIYV